MTSAEVHGYVTSSVLWPVAPGVSCVWLWWPQRDCLYSVKILWTSRTHTHTLVSHAHITHWNVTGCGLAVWHFPVYCGFQLTLNSAREPYGFFLACFNTNLWHAQTINFLYTLPRNVQSEAKSTVPSTKQFSVLEYWVDIT